MPLEEGQKKGSWLRARERLKPQVGQPWDEPTEVVVENFGADPSRGERLPPANEAEPSRGERVPSETEGRAIRRTFGWVMLRDVVREIGEIARDVFS